jgi:hypothetical protein
VQGQFGEYFEEPRENYFYKEPEEQFHGLSE